MTEKEVLRRFSAHRLEGALRFIAHEVRVGTEAPDLRCRTSAVKSVRLSSYREKSNVVLMFGSVTCAGLRNSTESRQTVPPFAVCAL